MPRRLRPIDDGLIYHVINRGNNRHDVFHKPADFHALLAALNELKGSEPFVNYNNSSAPLFFARGKGGL